MMIMSTSFVLIQTDTKAAYDIIRVCHKYHKRQGKHQVKILYNLGYHMKESTETTRNSRSLMKINGMPQHACMIQLKSAFVDVLALESGLHWRFELHNNYSVCNELQTHERINRNNKKLKELDENEWNATTCIIQLKSAFVDVLASESGLHRRFEHTITTVHA